MGERLNGIQEVRGSTPLISTSGKVPPPIIGGMRCYAKLHTTMAVFGFKAHASTNTKKPELLVGLGFFVLMGFCDRTFAFCLQKSRICANSAETNLIDGRKFRF